MFEKGTQFSGPMLITYAKVVIIIACLCAFMITITITGLQLPEVRRADLCARCGGPLAPRAVVLAACAPVGAGD